MKSSLESLCKSFISNRDEIKTAFKMESSLFYPICAVIHIAKRCNANTEKLKECHEILKQNTGPFSYFRGISKLVVMSELAVETSPERRLKESLQVYELLKKRFVSTEYMPYAAIHISRLVPCERYDEVSERTRVIYDRMRKEHPFLTTGDDCVFAALMAVLPRTDDEMIEDAAKCYDILKRSFPSGNALQALSHVTVLLNGDAEEKCEKTVRAFNMIKEKGVTFGRYYELAALAVAANSAQSIETAVSDILDVSDFLSTQKGYGFWSLGKKERLMHAAMIVALDYCSGKQNTANDISAFCATVAAVAAIQSYITCASATSVVIS